MVFLFLPVMAGASFEVKNDELDFRFTVPDGFKEYNPLVPHSDSATRNYVEANALYSYNKGGDPQANNWTGIFFNIERAMELNLGFEAKDFLSAGETLSQKKWGGCDISVVRGSRAYKTGSDEKMVTLSAQAPLKPKPILIKLTGVNGDEAEMNSIIDSVLASLEGESDCRLDNNKNIIIAVIVLVSILIIIKKIIKALASKTKR